MFRKDVSQRQVTKLQLSDRLQVLAVMVTWTLNVNLQDYMMRIIGMKIIKSVITNFVQKNKKRAIAFESLGQRNYLSVLQFVDGVVGNSSSGLLEAPSFKIGTINIGNRQDGRLKSKSVIDCDSTKESITVALKQLFSNDFKERLKSVKNPYGEGNASIKVIKFLEKVKIPSSIEKKFFDIC